MRVVVGDDDERFRAAVVEQLRVEGGHEAHTAGDADTLHALVDQTAPDVVLLDVGMSPGGATTCRRLLEEHLGLAVVATSGRADATSMREMIAAGARAYLAKGSLTCSLSSYLGHAVQGDLLLVGEGASELRGGLAAHRLASG